MDSVGSISRAVEFLGEGEDRYALSPPLSDLSQRVFIAKGSGVTLDYIVNKGSACVETFRDINHHIAQTFGHADRSRRHREVSIERDVECLCSDLLASRVHTLTANRIILTPAKFNRQGKQTAPPNRAVKDCWAQGYTYLSSGKFREHMRTSAYDGTASNSQDEGADNEPDEPFMQHDEENPLQRDGELDMDDGDGIVSRFPGLGSLGGGIDL